MDLSKLSFRIVRHIIPCSLLPLTHRCNVDKVLFYIPLIDLKVAIFSLMQVHMRNESKLIDILRKCNKTDDRFSTFERRIQSSDYLSVLNKNENRLRIK